MQSRFEMCPDKGRVEWHISGRFTRETLLAGWSALIERPDWDPALDLLVLIHRDALLGEIEFSDIQAFQAHMEESRSSDQGPTGARTAIVSEKREHWPLLQLHAMSFADRTLSDDAVFSTESEARAWLDTPRQTTNQPTDAGQDDAAD